MRIEIGGVELLSKRYESFDEIVDEFLAYESGRGRRVPSYDLAVMLIVLGQFILGAVAQKLIGDAMDWKRRRDQGIEDEQRHKQLLSKFDELIDTKRQVESANPPNLVSNPDAASLLALMEWAKREGISVSITLETEAEGDLKEPFEALTADVPESSVEQLQPPKSDDPT
jgi:hypothetical protein